MHPSTSKVTAQNQISIPAEVRRRFGIMPGTELVWEEKGGELVVHPKRLTLDDVRAFCSEARGATHLSLSAIRRARDAAVVAKHGRR
jgi:AbrB family looped-hinge helix DNA binding protein